MPLLVQRLEMVADMRSCYGLVNRTPIRFPSRPCGLSLWDQAMHSIIYWRIPIFLAEVGSFPYTLIVLLVLLTQRMTFAWLIQQHAYAARVLRFLHMAASEQTKQLPKIVTSYSSQAGAGDTTTPLSWSEEVLELGHFDRRNQNPPQTFRIPRKEVSTAVVKSPIETPRHPSIVPSVSIGAASSKWSRNSANIPIPENDEVGNDCLTPISPRDRFERNQEAAIDFGRIGKNSGSKRSNGSSIVVDVGEGTIKHDGPRQVFVRKESRGHKGPGSKLRITDTNPRGNLDSDLLSPISTTFYTPDTTTVPRTLGEVPQVPQIPFGIQEEASGSRPQPRRQDSATPLVNPIYGFDGNQRNGNGYYTPQVPTNPQISTPHTIPTPYGPVLLTGQRNHGERESSTGLSSDGGRGGETGWDRADIYDNPRNWATKKKWYNTLVISLYTAVILFTGAVYIPGNRAVASKFYVSETSSIIGFSMFTLGLLCGHPLNAVLSGLFGRKPIYGLALPISCLFTMGAGLADNFGTVVVCKIFAAIFASPAVAAGAFAVTEIWDSERTRIPVIVYLFFQYGAPCLGPLIGGFAVNYGTWRWTMWITLLASGIVYTLSYFISETHKETIIRGRCRFSNPQASTCSSPTPSRPSGSSFLDSQSQQSRPRRSNSQFTWGQCWPSIKQGIHATVIEAGKMFVLEPMITLLTLYLGFIFGCFYLHLVSFPLVFGTVYKLEPIGNGFTLLSLLSGMSLAVMLSVILHLTVYKRKQRRVMSGLGGRVPPEERLTLALLGSVFLPISLFWWAWSAKVGVHWFLPILGGVWLGFALFSILLGITLYLQDVYPTEHLVSVLSVNSAFQYLFGAVFPLLVFRMYENLSIGWAGSIMAFLSVLFVSFPWILWRRGREIRAASRWGVNVFCEKERG